MCKHRACPQALAMGEVASAPHGRALMPHVQFRIFEIISIGASGLSVLCSMFVIGTVARDAV